YQVTLCKHNNSSKEGQYLVWPSRHTTELRSHKTLCCCDGQTEEIQQRIEELKEQLERAAI
ncbi:MAG: hypothetical protein MUP27_07485, partial [Desulfobacterales bacterium]|nr:hypothetical protein [Desulfobacterales bacterium]